MAKIDLYLRDDIGLWALSQLADESIGCVFSDHGGIRKAAEERGIRCVTGDPEVFEFEPSPTLLSVHWNKIFKPSFLSKYTRAYNLHPGYLPWCRGIHSAFWALWTNSPAGATLHVINEAVDAGAIVDQQQVTYDDATTLPELLNDVAEAEKHVLLRQKVLILSGKEAVLKTPVEEGSFFSLSDYVDLMRHFRENWQSVSGADLIRLARCTSAIPVIIEDRVFNLIAQPLARSKPAEDNNWSDTYVLLMHSLYCEKCRLSITPAADSLPNL